MSYQRYTSIFLAILLICVVPAHAQINLDLLEDSPTPTPLPEGQEYILEIEQIHDTDTRKTLLSPADIQSFEKNGFIIHPNQSTSTLTIERTQLAFNSFRTEPVQEQETQLLLKSTVPGSYQLLFDVVSDISAGTSSIGPTSCDHDRPCTSMRSALWQDESAQGWGISFSGKQISSKYHQGTYYLQPSTEHTPIATLHTQKESPTTFVFHGKIAAGEETDDGLYSGVSRIIVLPF